MNFSFFLFTSEEIKEIHARNFFEKFVKTMRVEDFGGKIIRQNISHQNQGSFISVFDFLSVTRQNGKFSTFLSKCSNDRRWSVYARKERPDHNSQSKSL